MAVPYPSDVLPLPVRDGHEDTLVNAFTRFKRDDGKYRTVRRYSAQPRAISVTWKLTWDQLKYFEGFLEYDLKGGTEKFEIQFGPNEPKSVAQLLEGVPGAAFDEKTNHWRVTTRVQVMQVAPPRRPLTYYPPMPAIIPEPEKAQYQYNQPDALTIDKDETGPGALKSRRRFSSKLTEYRVQWLLDNEQMAAFDAFVHDEIADGLAYFKAPFASGNGPTQLRARFMSPPIKQPLGALAWRVDGQLETSEMPIISEYTYKYRNGLSTTDSLSFSEQVFFNVFRGAFFDEAFAYAEQVSFSLKVSYTEAIVFEEAVSLSATYSKMFEESLVFGESGSLSTANYVDDSYFSESYIGYNVSF